MVQNSVELRIVCAGSLSPYAVVGVHHRNCIAPKSPHQQPTEVIPDNGSESSSLSCLHEGYLFPFYKTTQMNIYNLPETCIIPLLPDFHEYTSVSALRPFLTKSQQTTHSFPRIDIFYPLHSLRIETTSADDFSASLSSSFVLWILTPLLVFITKTVFLLSHHTNNRP